MNSLLTTQSLNDFLVECLLLIFSVFLVVLLCVFTFLVSCCGVRYDFSLKTMSLPTVACRSVHVFMRFFVCVCLLIVVSKKSL